MSDSDDDSIFGEGNAKGRPSNTLTTVSEDSSNKAQRRPAKIAAVGKGSSSSNSKAATKKAMTRKKTMNETDDEGFVLANEGNATVELSISVPATRRRLLMVGLVEKLQLSRRYAVFLISTRLS